MLHPVFEASPGIYIRLPLSFYIILNYISPDAILTSLAFGVKKSQNKGRYQPECCCYINCCLYWKHHGPDQNFFLSNWTTDDISCQSVPGVGRYEPVYPLPDAAVSVSVAAAFAQRRSADFGADSFPGRAGDKDRQAL